MAITSSRSFWCLCSLLLIAATTTAARAEPKLFESRQVTPAGEYTFGIEGPAADVDGNLFVVNLGKPGAIGKLVVGSAQSEKFISLPDGSVGNAIRFDRDGTMFIVDYKKHNVFAIRKGGLEPEVHFHSDLMNQPNDLTIARDGTIYASDPNWKGRTGQIWRISKGADGQVQGQVMTAPRAMGTTNGIDLSPDGKTLYVGESLTGQLWAYRISGNELASARLLKTFEPDTIDGLRTDVDGKLLIARIQKGAITVMTPDGQLLRDIVLQGKDPTNLAFGGTNGRTVFVSQRQGGYIESFQTDKEGREYCMQNGRC
ncbi:SMP-30/gluconolactonase/LRE family protein [Tardiphaga sp. OK245]|uniref:SMP-30/gluconolactonase/LRE family protein n=1 Tax=Tardiphaga sp. OK245 TaxID=1855306 RepID=UPI0008A75FD1|nr:SMP-30/gluconolactonase/LRE family protein [Tardiphaga sp. OK245]SEH40239.1 signal peptidase, endoplasmic reticulum-type [Tardiphaga sp. OK245]